MSLITKFFMKRKSKKLSTTFLPFCQNLMGNFTKCRKRRVGATHNMMTVLINF